MFVEVAAVAAEAATVAGLFKAAARLRSVCSHTLVDVVTMSVHKMATACRPLRFVISSFHCVKCS